MRARIACPSGVGDCYWVATKLQAFRKTHSIEHLTLCTQKTNLTRALEWGEMVDFIDATEELSFKPDEEALATGYSQGKTPGADYCFWPNSILDRGGTLNDWLPHLATDLDFDVRTPDTGPPRAVLYASSERMNKSWMPAHGRWFWQDLIERMNATYGSVTLVGAAWDESYRDESWQVDDMVGRTTLPELAGIVRNARVVVGVICGVTILANHFRTPCVAVWPDWNFPESFPYSWLAKDAPYEALRSSNVTSKRVALAAAKIAR